MKNLKFVVFFLMLFFAFSCGQQKRYVSYKSKKGETLESIGKKWNVTAAELLLLNPQIGESLKENTTIFIPNNRRSSSIKKFVEITTTPPDSLTATDDLYLEELRKNFVIHKVKKKETIYGLKRLYNVSERELYALNPNLKKEGLKADSYIKIKPIPKEKVEEEKEEKEEETTTQIYRDSVAENVHIKLSMLLPFMAEKYDTVSSVDIFKKNKLANIVTDFFMGSKMAIDSLEKQGVEVSLKIFDTDKKNTKIKEIVNDGQIYDSDVIIGPFYSQEAKMVADKTTVPVIFPHFSKEQKYFSSSQLIKTAPEKQSYQEELISYLLEHYIDENIVVVGDEKSNTQVNKIVELFKQKDEFCKIHTLEPEEGYIKKSRFIDVLTDITKNWVLLITDDNSVITDAIINLISLPENINIQTFSKSKEKAFNNIDSNFLAKVGFTYLTNEFFQEDNVSYKQFINKYLSENGALPSNYAIKGFDITYDVLIRLASNQSLEDSFKKGVSYRLASKFDYHKNKFGSMQNDGLFILKYEPNLSLTRLK